MIRMISPENLEVALAWYRREQWALLRAESADADKLEKTYDEWLAFASEELRKLEARGIRVSKIDVEVGALTRWCESEGRAVDGEARAEYARRGLGREV
jgi:hypothetical protein